MDEITLFAILKPDAPDFAEADRGEVRCRLLAAAAGEHAAREQQFPDTGGLGRPRRALRSPETWRPWSPRRLGIAAAAAALAAAAAALVAAPLTGTRPGHHVHPPSAAAARSARPTTAAAVLLLAARAAAATPGLTAGPDQFVYTEQLIEGESYWAGSQNGGHQVHVPPYLQRSWQSADGKQGEASSQRNLRGGRWTTPGRGESMCSSSQSGPVRQICFPGYLANLPHTVTGMLSYLLASDGPNGPAAYRVLGGIVNTSSASGLLVPNQAYALMYQAAATVKGIDLVPRVTDIAGRAGIGVAACVPASIGKGSMPRFHGCPDRTELIFDARTYQLIGVDNTAAPGSPARPGSPSSALLNIAVTDRIGQLP